MKNIVVFKLLYDAIFCLSHLHIDISWQPIIDVEEPIGLTGKTENSWQILGTNVDHHGMQQTVYVS
jgi:hypothetical protein